VGLSEIVHEGVKTMKLSYLVGAAAATALLGGAAYAQLPNQSTPAPPTSSSTGLPSVDSTRPTGANAGATNLPGGEVSGSTSTSGSVNAGASTSSTSVGASTTTTSSTATSAGSLGTAASVTTTLVTNGPVPDTAENRAKYGGPMSRAGKRTAPAGN
jgi:hypothetical protein